MPASMIPAKVSDVEALRIRFFGTYHKERVARIAVLLEGLRDLGCICEEANVRLRLSHARRVAMLKSPWQSLALPFLLARAWSALLVKRLRSERTDAILVPYMGHFDVLWARVLHPRTLIVLDHLISAADTADDRRSRPWVKRMLASLDWLATAAADIVMIDTEDQREIVHPMHASKIVVVPVGAPRSWYSASRRDRSPGVLSIVFFGLFTPLQGTPVIARSLQELKSRGIRFRMTFVGKGQDYESVRNALSDDQYIDWQDWLDDSDLIQVVAEHDLCLGIFGTSAKARRVVPQKLYLGAAAGCALLTSATRPQMEAFGTAAQYVEPGNPDALADRIAELADSPELLQMMRKRSSECAAARFKPAMVAAVLKNAIGEAKNRPLDLSRRHARPPST